MNDSLQEPFKPVDLDPGVMMKAFMKMDAGFEGLFFAAVKTTGIFCRPTCKAKKPKPENVVFYKTQRQALLEGYRPCKLCKPLEIPNAPPAFVQKVLAHLDENPGERMGDRDLREMGIEPATLRRWFQKNHGMTFHAYQRLSRINHAFTEIKTGKGLLDVAMNSGYSSASGFGQMFKNLTGLPPSKTESLEVLNVCRFQTKLGNMIACANQEGVCLLEFMDRRQLNTELKYLANRFKAIYIPAGNPHLELLEKQIGEYFAGKRTEFDVPLVCPGTEFQNTVWAELRKIPFGRTLSYNELAERTGKPNAQRAVAHANGMNRLAILIPCHRVIGKDGSLRGYGGGVWRKRWLIAMEQKQCSPREVS